MSNEVKIDYEAVRNKTRELRSRIQAELREMDAGYRQVNLALNGQDGLTNATLIECVNANQTKAQLTAETVLRLLSFIDSAIRETEREEQQISRIFTSSRIRRSRQTGGDN